MTKPIKIGDAITKDMVQAVEVGGYNLPEDVVRHTDTVIGKFASADLAPGITSSPPKSPMPRLQRMPISTA